MYTRKQYIDGECTHRQYYAQFVTDEIKAMVVNAFGLERLKKAFSKGENLNSIPLASFDSLGYQIRINMSKYGDCQTLSGTVCILKAAARMAVEESR